MKKLFSRLPKKMIVSVATVSAIVGIASIAGAWSPERPTYTIENPADHVTFNSITNNPNYGDERTFFDVKDATNTAQGGFVDRQNVSTSSDELLLRVYVHNNAASSLNASGEGIARNTQVRIHLPTATDDALRANAYISADNATPAVVSDTVDFVGSSDFSLEYVPGSAVAYTNAVPSGMPLNDSIVTTGAHIGYDQANGNYPGCFEYTSIVTIKVKVVKPSYKVEKSVRLEGQTSNDWKENVTVDPGTNVEWRVAFTNTGTTQLKDVVVLDQVPAGLTVVPGSVKLYNSNNPNGYTYPDSAVQNNGRQVNVNIGTYNPGSNAFVLFKTKTPSAEELECGKKSYMNIAYATPKDSGTVNDGASVKVDTKEDCEEPEEPAYACDLVTVTKLGDRKVRVTTEATGTNGASVKQYHYNFGDGSDVLVTDQSTVEHTYAADGTYAIRVDVTFTVNGVDKTVSSENCEAVVTFTTDVPPTPETPELPKTGAASLIGLFTIVTSAAAIAHNVFSRRAVR